MRREIYLRLLRDMIGQEELKMLKNIIRVRIKSEYIIYRRNKEEIKSYIKRGISDIARKCHVYDDEVVKIIKQMLAI